MQDVGDEYGLTRERVRQITKEQGHTHIHPKDNPMIRDKVYNTVLEYWLKNYCAPSVPEVAKEVGRAESTVIVHRDKLVIEGRLHLASRGSHTRMVPDVIVDAIQGMNNE